MIPGQLCCGSRALTWHKTAGFALAVMMLLAGGSRAALCQSTNSGDIRGTVTDTTGALIPGAKVTVVNVNTGVSKDFVTNAEGLYDTSSIVAGSYTISFSKDGFQSLIRGPITLQVGVTTVNGQLKVGSNTEQVTVTSDVPLLMTESGEKSTTWDAHTMDAFPQVAGAGSQGQDWGNEIAFLPGFSGTASSDYGVAGMAQWGSANGSLPYNNVLQDGAAASLGGSMMATDATQETVAELQVSTSNFSAQYGSGGVVINQITKGGTNEFHGSAYDYIQNNAWNAASYGFGSQVPVNFIRYNNFGGSIGGPVIKKKMFFFFNYDQVVDHAAASNNFFSVPSSQVMNGDFGDAGITSLLYDPTTQTIATDSQGNLYPQRQSFQSEYGCNCIPSQLIDSVSNVVQQYYPTANSHISGSKFVTGTPNGVGVNQYNFFSSIPQSTPYVKYFGRLDYDITPKNRISMSDSQNDTPVTYPSALTECPIGCEGGDVDNNISQITDVWNISPSLINEARFGFTFQGNWFNDFSLNKGYANKVGWQFAKVDDFPTFYLGQNNYTSFGAATNATGFENVFDPSDVVTLIRGKHILHFGGEFLAYRMNYTAWGDENAGVMNFSGQYTQNWTLDSNGVASPDPTTGLDYADFLLGTVQSWNAGVLPEYGARLKMPQMFVQDDWKLRPNLTINLGVRYQMTHGMSEVHGNVDTFDPTIINPATNTPGAMWYGSTHAGGRSDFMASTYNNFMPRVGFSWTIDPNTTLRGGFGIYSYNFTLDMYGVLSPGGMGGPFGESGNVTDTTNGIVPVVKMDGTGNQYAAPSAGQSGLVTSSNALPYTSFATTPDAYNGQNVGYYQYHTPVPKIMQWNVGMQRMLSTNLLAEVSYVASHGYHLSYITDQNQVPAADLSPNDSQYIPYPNFSSISGSTNNGLSNYNSLQAILTKRMSNGLSVSASYVWSHFLDNQDSGGTGRSAGTRLFQIANNPASDYGNSNFDTRHAFKAYGVYELPIGKGRKFLNSNSAVDAVLGGWQIAVTALELSGTPFTVVSTQNLYTNVGTPYPNWNSGTSHSQPHSISNWYNATDFLQPDNGTFGNVRRNSLVGPGINEFNLSGSKTFSLPYREMKLQLRCDATNAFNHPSFSTPNIFLSGSSGPGTSYSGSTPLTSLQVGGRQVQLGAHLSF